MTETKSQDRDRPAEDGEASVLPNGSFGAWLRTQREARGVGLRDIADASKISVRYLEALEQNRFEILPAPVFTRGFLREYARVVGLDPDEVVNLYLLASREEEEDEEEEPVPTRRQSGPSPLVYVTLLLLAVAILLGLAALVSYWAKSRDSAPEPPPAIGAAFPEPVPPQIEAAPQPPPVPAASRVTAGPGGASAPGEGTPLRVQLEFTEDCWVEVVIDGRGRNGELRTSGEVVTIEAEEFVLLTLGNVSAVRVEVDGRPFELPEDETRVVRDLRIDRRSPTTPEGTPPGP